MSDLAANFEQGLVAPDGSIWLTPEARAISGIVQITVEEADKAECFGWSRQGPALCGYVHVERP